MNFWISLAIFKVYCKIILCNNTKYYIIPSLFSSCITEGVNSSVGRPIIGKNSGNVHLDRSKNEKEGRKSSRQTGNKNSKRKQVDLNDENNLCNNGNEPCEHKNIKICKTLNDVLQNKLDGKLSRVAKSKKCSAKDKLITGQAKLTQFFRLWICVLCALDFCIYKTIYQRHLLNF